MFELLSQSKFTLRLPDFGSEGKTTAWTCEWLHGYPPTDTGVSKPDYYLLSLLINLPHVEFAILFPGQRRNPCLDWSKSYHSKSFSAWKRAVVWRRLRINSQRRGKIGNLQWQISQDRWQGHPKYKRGLRPHRTSFWRVQMSKFWFGRG